MGTACDRLIQAQNRRSIFEPFQKEVAAVSTFQLA